MKGQLGGGSQSLPQAPSSLGQAGSLQKQNRAGGYGCPPAGSTESMFCALEQRGDPMLPSPHLWQQVLLSEWSSPPSPSSPGTSLPFRARCLDGCVAEQHGSYMTLNKSHHIPQPPFPHLEHRADDSTPITGCHGD